MAFLPMCSSEHFASYEREVVTSQSERHKGNPREYPSGKGRDTLTLSFE